MSAEAVAGDRVGELVHNAVMHMSQRELEKAVYELAGLARNSERLLYIAEHLFQMVPQSVWREHGAEAYGMFEGDYHAEKLRDELAALRAATPDEAKKPDWATGPAVVSRCVFCHSTRVWEIGNAAWKCDDCGKGGPGVRSGGRT